MLITTDKKNLIARCFERGYSLEEVMPCVVKQDGDQWTIDITHEKYPRPKDVNYNHPTYKISEKLKQDSIGEGVGTELKKLLKLIGIVAAPGCSCNARAKLMNDNGIQWCKDNISTIVSWLKEEAEKRKLPFLEYVARKIIKVAIYKAEKNQQ